ncbi:carboxypeptidase S [Dendrothele bispora CBS 962.96]|uniref:Carboxypeptidase S n=1 Tax=Dendrothele bispora (strain CBS 962.96) TaxID=1314807 RepID=A0A4S8KNZ8_DENBC|nr:carboxypeptidase S [Dendrothele bispora CBS 962.96]
MPILEGKKNEPLFPTRSSKTSWFRKLAALVGLTIQPTLEYLPNIFQNGQLDLCHQEKPLVPQRNSELWSNLSKTFETEGFKDRAIGWLAGAVKYPTESYDNMDPVGVDPRWDTFGPLQEYLISAFPLVNVKLSLAKVNTYGLLYEWTGSDTSLKPIVLAAHQDVVPVLPETVKEWTHPPYSGYFDGTRIWGRGASDDKSGLIGILSAVESMLEKGFEPTRTVVLAFGFDEEAHGHYGAAELAKAMLDVYGENAFAFIIDEGGGFGEVYGSTIATPSIAEKGYMDLLVEVASPGGHSSVPPKHTSIGMLARVLVELEDHPYPVQITKDHILYRTLQCFAAHSKDLPKDFRKAIKRSASSKKAMKALNDIISQELRFAASVGTTQALDLINGGVKTNALPERASAVINHRISTLEHVSNVKEHSTKTVKHLADKFNLTFNAFGITLTDPSVPKYGDLSLSVAFGKSDLEPAPITPTEGSNAGPYKLLSSTIKAAYREHRGLGTEAEVEVEEDDDIVVAPGMSTGNTDTKYYWDLTEHILRYNHRNAGTPEAPSTGGVHTVNEYIEVDSFLEMIKFFSMLILNADESTTI